MDQGKQQLKFEEICALGTDIIATRMTDEGRISILYVVKQSSNQMSHYFLWTSHV